MNPFAFLLGQAPWEVMAAVLARVDTRTREALLARPPMPGEALTAYVVAHGSSADRAALASNPAAGPDVLDQLGLVLDPVVGAALYRNPRSTRDVAVRVLTRAPIDAALRDELATTDDPRLLYPLIESYEPELVTHALTALTCERVYPAAGTVVLRGCLNLWRRVGPDAVEAVLDAAAQPPGGQPDDAFAIVRDALGDPKGRHVLGRRVELGGSTRVVVQRLRSIAGARGPYGIHGRRTELARLVLHAPHEPLRWDVVREEHWAERLPDHALIALSDLPDLPQDLATVAAIAVAAARRSDNRVGRPKPSRGKRRSRDRSLLDTPLSVGNGAHARLRDTYNDGGIPATRILAHGAPAAAALATFEGLEGPRLDEARQAVGRLTARGLGDHVEAWAVSLALLDDFVGTVPELIDTATAVTM